MCQSEQVEGLSGFDVSARAEGCRWSSRASGRIDWAVHCATSSAVTRVDDAKAVTFRIRKDDEVWIGRAVPHDASGAETDQPLDLIGLFVGIVDDEVDVKSWTFLGRGGRSMNRNASSLTGGWHEDREAILGRREPNGPVAKDARPERNCSVHVIGTEHHGAESNHHLSLTRRPDPVRLGCESASDESARTTRALAPTTPPSTLAFKHGVRVRSLIAAGDRALVDEKPPSVSSADCGLMPH